MIEFKNVNKHYGSTQVLHDVSATVDEGKIIVLCGPSGSGKSTLIRTINRLEEITSGDIRIDGTSVHSKAVDINQIRSQIGFVFQQFNLFPHLNVTQNVSIGPTRVAKVKKEEALAKAKALLKRVGLVEKLNSFPGELSGGQQQRVAIARALAQNPRIVLLDEPTSALDPEMVNEVLSVIKDLATQNMTMLCVTHELGFAREIADEMWFMDKGRLIERNVPNEFFSRPQNPRLIQFLKEVKSH